MGVTLWKSFGASVRGPGHIAEGLPNQDAWMSFHYSWGNGIMVSDGVGSKPFSNFGSAAACLAVDYAALACRSKVNTLNAKINRNSLFEDIKAKWLSFIEPLEPRDCSATCLFAVQIGDGLIHFGMLGDGLLAVIKGDGSVISCSEIKINGFSNITTALSPNISSKDWQYFSLPEEECLAVLLCTDGVADDLDDMEGFVRGFFDGYRSLAALSASRNVREMLEKWPTPKHSDDKTLACLCREEFADV
nr:PP2C family serine/threonine-protein phosphatase [Acetobacter persici]